jgi:hypothetical protein
MLNLHRRILLRGVAALTVLTTAAVSAGPAFADHGNHYSGNVNNGSHKGDISNVDRGRHVGAGFGFGYFVNPGKHGGQT